jgi:hypothetical protein
MLRPTRLTALPRPFICCVLIDDATPDAVIRTIKLAEYDGADAFELDLQALAPEYRRPQALASIFAATNRPILTVYRRYDMSQPVPAWHEPDEQARMQLQLDCLDLGAAGFDMELDTFDPRIDPWPTTPEGLRYAWDPASPPREVSEDERAVERQRAVIEEAHRRGGEVMASTHALTRLPPDACVHVGRLAEGRGADALKIVRFNGSYQDIVETLATTVAMREVLRIPFVMMAMGEYGKLTRPIAPLFGSMLVYAKQDYRPGGFYDQPPIRAMRAVFANIDMSITRRAEQYVPRDDDR